MKGSTHAVTGALGSFLLIMLTPYKIIFLLISTFGALFPDIDASEAKVHYLGFYIGRIRIAPFRPIGIIFSSIFRHRGFVHSFFGLFIFTSIFSLTIGYFFPNDVLSFTLCFAIGYFLHLIFDGMTYSGVPFFFPISRNNQHVLPKPLLFKTGGLSELNLQVLFLVILGFLLFGFYTTGKINDVNLNFINLPEKLDNHFILSPSF